MADLEELALRVERAIADEQGEMILLAFGAMFPKPESDYQPRREPNFSPEWLAWAKLAAKVRNFVQAGAFFDAVMALVPEGMDWGVNLEQGRGVAYTIGKDSTFSPDTVAATPALALTAAALRARTQGNPNG